MKSADIKECVQNLLDADIQASDINKETGINYATISKLRSKAQNIDDTNFITIRRLFDFYLRKQKEIEARKGIPDYILSEKLPNRVNRFLEELAIGVNLIHKQETSRINKVYIYDEFILDDKGNSKEKKSYIEVNETIPVSKNNDVYSYNVAVKNKINKRKSVDAIRGLRIVFNKEKLEITLKKYKYEGAKIRTYKTRDGGISLKITFPYDDKEIYGIESEYFEIQYQDAEDQLEIYDQETLIEDNKKYVQLEQIKEGNLYNGEI